MAKQELIDAVLKQIVSDVQIGDLTAIEELLRSVDEEELEGFLGEEFADYEYDGQPDEAQEWHDFDPDC